MSRCRLSARWAAGLTVIVVAGCSTGPDLPDALPSTSAVVVEDAGPVGVRDATVVWSAEPGIDLFDERGRMVRAAQESDWIGLIVGSGETYPGFMDAVGSYGVFKFDDPGRKRWPVVGTFYWHILDIVDTSAGFEAVVCNQSSRIAELRENNTYVTSFGPASSERVTFERVLVPSSNESVSFESKGPSSLGVDRSSSSGRPQWQRLSENVFSGWSVSTGGKSAAMQACKDWGYAIVPKAPVSGSRTVRSDVPPVTVPAYPGW
ncbi:hypothetical protein ABH922_004104 [Rhodococcus sp. 27YEA15]